MHYSLICYRRRRMFAFTNDDFTCCMIITGFIIQILLIFYLSVVNYTTCKEHASFLKIVKSRNVWTFRTVSQYKPTSLTRENVHQNNWHEIYFQKNHQCTVTIESTALHTRHLYRYQESLCIQNPLVTQEFHE